MKLEIDIPQKALRSAIEGAVSGEIGRITAEMIQIKVTEVLTKRLQRTDVLHLVDTTLASLIERELRPALNEVLGPEPLRPASVRRAVQEVIAKIVRDAVKI